MRRVYYAFAIRVISTTGVVQGAVMFAVLLALTQFVSLGNVVHNFMSVPVGNVGTFFYNAITTTELWTLLLIGVFVFSALSFRITVSPMRATHGLAKI